MVLFDINGCAEARSEGSGIVREDEGAHGGFPAPRCAHEKNFLLHRSTMGSGFSQPATATMTPAYLVLVAARCVAALMPGPARAALTLLRRRIGTVHDCDCPTPTRGVSAKMTTENLSFRGCGTYSKKFGVISSPSTHRSARLWTNRDSINPVATRGAFYSCKRPYGGYATAYVLAVLATSARNWSHMKRFKESSANLVRYSVQSFQQNVHQNLNSYFLSSRPRWKTGERFLLSRSKLRYSITVLLGRSTVRKVPSFYLSETTILVLPAPSPFQLCLDSSAWALDL